MNSLRYVSTVCLLVCSCALFAADDEMVAARVGEDAISIGEVTREMKQALGARELSEREKEVLTAQTLGLLVNRQLTMQYLAATKQGASEADIDEAIERLRERLKPEGKTLTAQLKELNMTLENLRRVMAWEQGWPRYLATKINPKSIQTYFEKHRREFDGTKLHVAHLLLKVEKPDEQSAVDEVAKKAESLRNDINAKKLTFTDAAKQHSQAPTATEGGDIGLISRHDPMPEAFNEAAYELKIGETSEPVLTTFGVHLVHLIGEEPGKLTLEDDQVDQTVREELVRYLFMWIAERQRATTKVEFTGALPYFDSQSGKLVSVDPTAQ